MLRLALHKIKVDYLPQEKVRQEEIVTVTVLISWLGRGNIDSVLLEICSVNDISMNVDTYVHMFTVMDS